jgi:hypothetical protein
MAIIVDDHVDDQKVTDCEHTAGGQRIGMFGKQENSFAYLPGGNVALTYPADILILPPRKKEY